MKKDLRTIAVAALMLAVVAGAPAVGGAVATFARNADKVDGKHAVASTVGKAKRKGKLVATSKKTGRLPNNIIAKARNADKLDGKNSTKFALKSTLSVPGRVNQSLNPVHWTKLRGVPQGLADGVDAIGPSAFGRIKVDGTIHANAVNLQDVEPVAGEGIYCFDLAEVPVHVDVTPLYTDTSNIVSSGARGFATVSPDNPPCPAPHDDAMVTFRMADDSTVRGPFFVSFMW